jgi:hypothetical protein
MKLKILIHVSAWQTLGLCFLRGVFFSIFYACEWLFPHCTSEWIKCWIYKRVTHILNALRFCVEMWRLLLLWSWSIGLLLLPGACGVSLSCGGFLVIIDEKYMMLCRSCIINGLPPCSLVFWTLKRFPVIPVQCSSEMIQLLFCRNHKVLTEKILNEFYLVIPL